MRVSRLLLFLLICVMVSTLIAGCKGSETEDTASSTSGNTVAPTDKPEEILDVRYVIPGNAPEDNAAALEAINQKLADDGVNVKIIPNYISWDVWDQKLNIMLSTGEEFELFQVLESYYVNLAGKGAIIPLDELVEQNGPALKENIPDWMWKGASVNGKIYTIPAYWVELAGALDCITMRKDLFRDNNLSLPNTNEELLSSCEIINKNWKGDQKMYIAIASPTMDETFRFLHRAYDSYPFVTFQQLIYVDQNENIKSWVETEEFKKDCEWFRQAYLKGLIVPDIMSIPEDARQKLTDAGNFIFTPSVSFWSWPQYKKNGLQISEEDYDIHYLYPEKTTKFREYAVRNSNAIPVTATHPEAGVKFVNWLYGNQDNYDLFMYGVKDKHWKEGPNHTREMTLNPKTGTQLYNFADWMIGNISYIRYQVTDHPRNAEILANEVSDGVNSIVIDFIFDPTPVSTEYNNCIAEFKASFVPMKVGAVDYAEQFEAANAKMKAAGIDKVIAEYIRQYNAWKNK